MRRLLSPTSLLVTVLCAVVAFGMSVLYRDYAVKAAVPLILLIALIPVVHLSGRTASLVVAILSGFIFAAYLFEPYGSLAIRDAADRVEMLVFGVAALGIIHFSPIPEAMELCGDCAIKRDLHKKVGLTECQMVDLARDKEELRLAQTLKPSTQTSNER